MHKFASRHKRTGITAAIFLAITLGSITLTWAGEENQAETAPQEAGINTALDLRLPELTQTFCDWDQAGHVIRETVFDPEGNPAMNARGFHRAEYARNEHGDILTEEYYGLNGEPVDTTDTGYARAEYTYFTDSQGHTGIMTEDRYAADGSRADIPGSYSYRRDTWEDGNLRATEYFDAEGNLTRPTGGYAQILYEIEDRKGSAFSVTKRYLDEDGSPLIGTEGGATVVSVYSAKACAAGTEDADYPAEKAGIPEGEMIEKNLDHSVYQFSTQEIFGIDGKPVPGKEYWHRQEQTYDDNGSLIRTDYFDTEGEPILSEGGYASEVCTYDNLNRIIERDYLGCDGELIQVEGVYALVTFEYYKGSNLKHCETYYGADGQRTMTIDGFSVAEYEYNGDDFDYRITWYDTADEYTLTGNSMARIEYKFADVPGSSWKKNQRVSEALKHIRQEKYFGTDLELINVKAGYAGYVNERNEYGQVTSVTFMDENWEPTCSNELQYASIHFEYEGTAADANPVYEKYFDEDGNPVEAKDGCCARSMT